MASKLLTPVRGWSARRELRAARRRADEEILGTNLLSPRLAWRARELTGPPRRSELARSLTDVVHAADERLLPNASPLDRPAARVCRPQLLELASLVWDLSRPVSARGILLVERLLADGGGPLYGHNDPQQLRAALEEARATLVGDGGRR